MNIKIKSINKKRMHGISKQIKPKRRSKNENI